MEDYRRMLIITLKNSLLSDDYLNIEFFTVNEGILYLLVRVNSFDYKIIKAEPVQAIGSKFVIYKRANKEENRKIELPKKCAK